MHTRYFAFGCSFVDYQWPTIADYIGVNFDEYYNLGLPGACNTLSSSRLMEVDELYNLNPETDFVTVGITGYGRFSIGFDYTKEGDRAWLTAGDTLVKASPNHPYKTKLFAKQLDNYDWACYRSWVAIKTMHTVLKAKQIKHVIYSSIDNLRWGLDYKVTSEVKNYLNLIDNYLGIEQSLDEFSSREQGFIIDHPTPRQHYLYLQKYFPTFDTEVTKSAFKFFNSLFTDEERLKKLGSTHDEFKQWTNYKSNYRKKSKIIG